MRESAARAAAARRRPPFRLKDLPAHDDQVPIEGVGDSARICSVCERAGLGRYVSIRSPMHHISVVAVRFVCICILSLCARITERPDSHINLMIKHGFHPPLKLCPAVGILKTM